MSNDQQLIKKCCKAMIDAGIDDPVSTAGILFCAGSRDDSVKSMCPYDYCVVLEHKNANKLAKAERMTLAQALVSRKVSRDDVALILGVSLVTVHKYIRGNR